PGKNTGVGCHFLLQCMKVKSEKLPKGSLEKCLIISSHLSKIAAANSTNQRWKNLTLASLQRSSENIDIPGSPRNKK
uniref:Uncharacterized protein n=1 Tax=Bos indicus x Bos taurus TaxID=30522 RepID=A0A4W2DNB7_BOBOX